MAIPQKIIKFLEKAKVKYEPVSHRTVYTAFDKAKTLRVPEKSIGKTLILRTNGDLIFSLVSADKNLDKKKLGKILKGKKLDFATERAVISKIKGVKVGAIPPFGSLWKFRTFADKGLLKSPKIIVNGGNYGWSIKISSSDFKKLIPDLAVGNFAKSRK